MGGGEEKLGGKDRVRKLQERLTELKIWRDTECMDLDQFNFARIGIDKELATLSLPQRPL